MSEQSQAFFHNARNVSLRDSSITATIHNHDSRSTGIHLLSQAVSKSAMHDSSARSPPPRCHPVTREWALNTLVAFIQDPNPEQKVIWMYAPFGHGKSAVMQTVIELLKSSGPAQVFAGGFFFGRDKEGRDKPHHLLPTIIYQIALNIRGMYEHINNAVNADPTLPYKSIEEQLLPLLVEPFRQHLQHSACIAHAPTVFIDGLDECGTHAAQRSVLKMIVDVIWIHQLPLRFIVASRPEAHISDYFHREPLCSRTRFFELDRDFSSMKEYLRDGLNKIYHTWPDIMSAVPHPWPTEDIIHAIVGRASGQYLFLSTILEFVGDEYANPLDQLQIILAQHSQQSSAFTGMDALYYQILSVCPSWLRESLLRILAAVIVCVGTTVASLSDFLQLDLAKTSTILRSLRSIIYFGDLPQVASPNSNFRVADYFSPWVFILHISFKEYLTDKSRSGEFWVDEHAMRKELLRRADFLLSSCLSSTPEAMHPTTWGTLENLANSAETRELDWFPWFHTIEAFSSFKNDEYMTCPSVTLHPEQVRAFRFLDDNGALFHDVHQHDESTLLATSRAIVVDAFRQWLSVSTNSTRFFSLIRQLRDTARYVLVEGRPRFTFKPPQLTLPATALPQLIVDGGGIFLKVGAWSNSEVDVSIDLSIMKMLDNLSFNLGAKAHLDYREARIFALSDHYRQSIIHKDLDLFKDSAYWFDHAASWGTSGALTLKPNVDNEAESALCHFINNICSPDSQAMLFDPNLLFIDNFSFFIPLVAFLAQNYVEACRFEVGYSDILHKLKDLLVKFVKEGILLVAFRYPEPLYLNQIFILYERLFGPNNFGRESWSTFTTCNDHTAIIEFFLDLENIKQFLKNNRKSENLTVDWRQHFSQARYSEAIVERLCSLHEGLADLNQKTVAIFLSASFVTDVRNWSRKHLASDSPPATTLEKQILRIQYSSDNQASRQRCITIHEEAPSEEGEDEELSDIYEDALEEQEN